MKSEGCFLVGSGCTDRHHAAALHCEPAEPMGGVTQLHAFTTGGNTLVSRLQHKGMYNPAAPIVGLGSAVWPKCSWDELDGSWMLTVRATEPPPDCTAASGS